MNESIFAAESAGAAGRGDTMRVYRLVRPGELRLEAAPIPLPAEGEVVARVSTALTCGTDLKTLDRGHARLRVPSPLGHEWAGCVATVGAGVSAFRPGDRIVATPSAPCGDCAYCLRGAENLCLHLLHHMALGAYGEFILIPRHVVNRNSFIIPDEITDQRAAFLEPLACAVHGADLVQLSGDRTIAFLGDGPLSLLFMQVAILRGAGGVAVIGRHAVRLELARQLGADVAVNSRETDAREVLRAFTDGLGADTVIECVGRPEAWVEAVGLTRRGGEVLLFGGCEKGASVSLDTERIHYEEISLRGGFHYTPDSVRRAWELIASESIVLDPLVTRRMNLEELPEAFELMRQRLVLKVAITP